MVQVLGVGRDVHGLALLVVAAWLDPDDDL
jgi:hypothetical protein